MARTFRLCRVTTSRMRSTSSPGSITMASRVCGSPTTEHFSEPAAEYRLARESVVLLDSNYHVFIYFEGPDRVRYLNAVLTNNVKDLVAGQGNVSLLLNPQGHILAEIEIYALEEGLLAVSHAAARERTAATLDKFIIMDDVAMDDATDRTGSLALARPQAPAGLPPFIGPKVWSIGPGSHSETLIAKVPCRALRKTFFGGTGVELIALREHLAGLWSALLAAVRAFGGGQIGYATLNSLRLESGVPWFGYDFDDKYIPHEAALESSHISNTKGCYVGQEIVERVRSRGHVNRRRVGLQFSGPGAPAGGTKLLADGKEVGHGTSSAYPPAPDRPIGMGYVRREHNALGSRLQWSAAEKKGEAEVIELPIVTGKTVQGRRSS